MRSDEIFELLVGIEDEVDTSELRWKSFNLWPLLRQILYINLQNNAQASGNPVEGSEVSLSQRLVARLGAYKARISSGILTQSEGDRDDSGIEERAFISRAVYLQQLPSSEYFDRIVDPLVFLSKNRKRTKKFYIGHFPANEHLSFPAEGLKPGLVIGKRGLSPGHFDIVRQVASLTGLDDGYLESSFTSAIKIFTGWYGGGGKFLDARKRLREIFVTSWYFPDVMGICAAARERGVKVIDVQHGKQGRYQAMYNGWTKIPEQGYDLMPDYFWCWGQPSCNHILAYSPARKIHRPFVGGFPWLDYYRTFVAQTTDSAKQGTSEADKLRVLVTTQPSQASNLEPIPDFLVEFLRSARPEAVNFVFRCHPNDHGGVAYCKKRLASVPASVYSIDDGKDNLYDKLLASTHHVTAYSSCCYEAEALGVPTLLFGEDAKKIYADEIESGSFAWTSGNADEFASWMEGRSHSAAAGGQNAQPYILSSMDYSSGVLASMELA